MSLHLLDGAARSRCGLLLGAQALPAEACDLPGLYNVAVPADPSNPWQTTSGAVGTSPGTARAAAVAEGLERYAAALVPLETRARQALAAADRLDENAFALFSDAQRRRPDFPWPLPAGPEDRFVRVYRLADNRPCWVPQELVGLGPRVGTARLPSTSSGLAAHRDAAGGPWLALLRAAQEVLERDALSVVWLNGLGGRELPVPAALRAAVERRGGEVMAFDLTQRWNPHPVIAVAGGIPCEGMPRHVFGIACRADAAEALDKAAQEWGQSLTFAGHMLRERRHELPRQAPDLRRFDEHAAFYSLRPDLWPETPLLRHRRAAPSIVRTPPPPQALAQLHQLQRALGEAGIDLYYRELTTADVAAAGLRVMRVLSPQLSGLHADERAPFLGGRCDDVDWRYPGERRHTAFPNPLPHPLG